MRARSLAHSTPRIKQMASSVLVASLKAWWELHDIRGVILYALMPTVVYLGVGISFYYNVEDVRCIALALCRV